MSLKKSDRASDTTTNGMGDASGFVNGMDALMDGSSHEHAGNYSRLVPSRSQYPQPVPTPSNPLARRQMNRVMHPANLRANPVGTVDSRDHCDQDENSLLLRNPGESLAEQDNVELLEEMALKAKREARVIGKHIPPFVQKLNRFVEERKNKHLIRWSEKGDSFIVLDEDDFAKKLIPELFKHNNYASFARQLNMYGFHKRVRLSDNSMRASESKNKDPSEYSNPYFRRGHPNLLWLINKPKHGSRAKKGVENASGGNGSEEEVRTEEVLGQGQGASNTQAGRSLPAGESLPLLRKMTLIGKELNKVRDQQKLVLGAINRLQRNHDDLYNQVIMFQNQHDRHQNSINAIQNFLANVSHKALEDQGENLIQQMDPTTYGTPDKARGLLPPIPNHNNQSQSFRSSPAASSSSQPIGHPNMEVGYATEPFEGSLTDTASPDLRQEPQDNLQERMTKIINGHNATNSHALDVPEAAEIVANAPNTLRDDQRSKLANFMAGQSSSAPSVRSAHAPNPVSTTPSVPRVPTSNPSMTMPTIPASTSVSPPPIEANSPPSLSPIMQPPIAPPSLNESNTNQVDLEQLQRLQSEQDVKVNELESLLDPLSPSGHIPGLDEGTDTYLGPLHVDVD